MYEYLKSLTKEVVMNEQEMMLMSCSVHLAEAMIDDRDLCRFKYCASSRTRLSYGALGKNYFFFFSFPHSIESITTL